MNSPNKFIVTLTLSQILVACAQPQVIVRYSKPDATQTQFMKDRYECLQESQQRESGAYVNPYAGAASSQMVVPCSVFKACLGARGYVTDPNGNLTVQPDMIIRCRQ